MVFCSSSRLLLLLYHPGSSGEVEPRRVGAECGEVRPLPRHALCLQPQSSVDWEVASLEVAHEIEI